MSGYRLAICSALLAVFLVTAIVVADGAAEFMSIYGDRIKKITETADTDDDAELAETLLRDLVKVKNSDLRRTILTTAYDLGIRSDKGLESAKRAVDLFAAEFPVPASEILSKRRQLAEVVYDGAGPDRAGAAQTLIGFQFATAKQAAADGDHEAAHRWMTRAFQVAREAELSDIGAAIQFEIGLMEDRRKAQDKIDTVGSDVSKTDELIALLLTEADDVPAARRVAENAADETLSRIVEIAATDLQKVQQDDLLFAGGWYMRQSRDASEAGRIVCLHHVHDYYKRYLILRQDVDEVRLRAESSMRSAEAKLEQITAKRLEPLLRGHKTIKVAPWHLYALADDACEIHINGQLVLTTSDCKGNGVR